jgi:hypothetical protein
MLSLNLDIAEGASNIGKEEEIRHLYFGWN